MKLIYYVFVSASLMVFQTIVCPGVPLLSGFYDILIPLIVYLTLFRPVRETLPAVLCLGFVMDNLTGGAFGLYITTYIWLFISVRWMLKYLRVGNTLLLPLVITIGVLMENVIFLSVQTLITPGWGLSGGAIKRVVIQLLWSALTGLFVLVLLDTCWKWWNNWRIVRGMRKSTDEA